MAFGDLLDSAATNVNGTPSQNISVTLPLGAPDAGDLLVAVVTQQNDTSTPVTCPGFTALNHGSQLPDGYEILYRTVLAGDPAAWTFTGFGSSKRLALARFEGPFGLSPLDVDATPTNGSTNAASIDVTPTAGEDVLLIGYAIHPTWFGAGATPGAGMTEIDDGGVTLNTDPGHWFGYRVALNASGAYTLACTLGAAGFFDWEMRGVAFASGALEPPGVNIYDPEGGYLTTLASIKDQMIQVELNGPGSGQFTISKGDPQATAANIAKGNLVRVTIPEIDPEQAIFEWVLETGDFELLSPDEEGGQELTFGGPGALTLLKKALIWHESNVIGSGWVHADAGVWRFEDESTGYILRQMLQEAQNRSPSPLPAGINIQFGAINDSNAVPWPTFAGRYELAIGSNIYDETMRLVEQGRMRVRWDPGFYFRAFQNLGGDKSGSFGIGNVRFEGIEDGTMNNIVESLNRSIGGGVQATHALVRGSAGYVTAALPAYTPGDPVTEVYVDQSGTSDGTELENAGLAALQLREDAQQSIIFAAKPGNDEANGLYYPGPAFSANGKYWPGDLVTLHTGTGDFDYNEETFRIVAITLSYDETGALAPPIIELNAPYPDAEIPTDNSKVVERSSGGGSSTGTGLHFHPQYQTLAERGLANGYASLDSDGWVPPGQLGDGTPSFETVLLGDQSWRLDNLNATTDPGVGDDSADGYKIGSRWINVTGDKEWVATDVSAGAAVWKETTAGGTISDILDLPTAETDDTLVLAPDGAGGVEFRAEVGGGSGTTWVQDISETGASFANFTAGSGTWSSNGTEIIQTDTAGAFRQARHNTKVPSGFPVILEAEVWFHAAGQGGGGLNYVALIAAFDNAAAGIAVILDRANGLMRFQNWGTTDYRTIATTVAADTWYKVRVVVNGQRVSAYKDGVLIGTTNINAVPVNADYVGLGSYASTVKFRNIKAWTLTGSAPA